MIKGMKIGETVVMAGSVENKRVEQFLHQMGKGQYSNLGKPGDQFWTKGKTGYSYATPIVRFSTPNKKIFVNKESYSKTTDKLQKLLMTRGKELGLAPEGKPESYFQ